MDVALSAGANALEMDLIFTAEGTPTHFFHTCNCHCLLNTGTCPYHMGNYCEGSRNASEVLGHFMTHKARNQISFIKIDCKTAGVRDLLRAGEQVIAMLERELFEKGYLGNVLVFEYYKAPYHSSLGHAAMQSPYQSQIFLGCERAVPLINDFTSSDIKAKYFEQLEVLTQAKLNYKQKMFSIGAGICFQDVQYFYTEVVLGRINTAKGLFSEVTVWTVNEENDFDRYYDLGARSLMTDNIEGLVSWARERGYPLYKLGDPVRRGSASPSEVVIEIGECECGYRDATEMFMTWSDVTEEFTTDTEPGYTVGYSQEDIIISPTRGVFSPTKGAQSPTRGAYSGEMYSPSGGGGCVITAPAPPFSSCQCNRDSRREQCQGRVVGCRDVNDKKCASPDTSLTACLLGSGDCGGYYPTTCWCQVASNGSCLVKHGGEMGCSCQCHLTQEGKCKVDILDCVVKSSCGYLGSSLVTVVILMAVISSCCFRAL